MYQELRIDSATLAAITANSAGAYAPPSDSFPPLRAAVVRDPGLLSEAAVAVLGSIASGAAADQDDEAAGPVRISTDALHEAVFRRDLAQDPLTVRTGSLPGCGAPGTRSVRPQSSWQDPRSDDGYSLIPSGRCER